MNTGNWSTKHRNFFTLSPLHFFNTRAFFQRDFWWAVCALSVCVCAYYVSTSHENIIGATKMLDNYGAMQIFKFQNCNSNIGLLSRLIFLNSSLNFCIISLPLSLISLPKFISDSCRSFSPWIMYKTDIKIKRDKKWRAIEKVQYCYRNIERTLI